MMEYRFHSTDMPSSQYDKYSRHDYVPTDYSKPNGNYGNGGFQQLQPDGVTVTTHLPQTGSYDEYPASRPFIYDTFRRDETKPVEAYPENNRQAVMSALQSLQEKIRDLEIERTQAEHNLKTLTNETSRFKDLLHRDPDLTDGDTVPNVSTFANTTRGTEVHTKLDTAEHKCKILEQQLDCMRNMVQNAEYDRTEAIRKSAVLDRHREEAEQDDLRHQLDKITDLERDHLKLTATQTLAENKIRQLEEKLKEEKHYRKIMQSKAAELETATEAHRILTEATGTNSVPRPKTKKVKKKKKVTTTKTYTNNHTRPSSAKIKKPNTAAGKKPGMEPLEHYKLNMGQIPFISGKSITPSHSLAANFQEVLSLMKSHNPKLCHSPRNHTHTQGLRYFQDNNPPTRKTAGDLTDLLLQLQDEFGLMSFEHQELNQQIQSATDGRLQDDLERELDALVAKMESKGQQIARLRRHLDELNAKSKQKKYVNATSTTMEHPVRDTDFPVNGHVEVTTTIRTKGKGEKTRCSSAQPALPGSGHASLNLYKGLKKIQNTLRRDDLSWDC